MAEARATCKQCKTEMTLQPIDPVCGAQGALKVTLMQLPALVCPNTHRRFALRDFPMVLLDRVAGEEMPKLPAGEKRGLLIKHYHCGACGARLSEGEGREETFDFDVALEGLPRFRVELTVPLHKCTSCGKEQVRSLQEMQELTAPAMARAFKAADLHLD
jgi:hypothetical protein